MKSMSLPDRERPPRSFWFDPRFGIGIGLVAMSVIGVVVLVSSADRTTEVWAAREPLSAGDTVTDDDLVLRNVRLGDADDLYLAREALPSGGVVITHSVGRGELLPSSAVGATEGLETASIVVTVLGQLPQSVAAGSVVDLWSSRETTVGVFGPPAVLVPSATVVRIVESDGLIVDGDATGVELLVPRSTVAAVLESIANSDAMSLVPANLPLTLTSASGE